MRFERKILVCAITFLFFFILTNLALAAKPDPSWIDMIRKGLNNDDAEVRTLAVTILGELKDSDSSDNLKALLKDESRSVRIRAAVALHKLGDNTGLEEIVRILVTKPQLSKNPKALERMKAVAAGTKRIEAALALSEVDDKKSIPLLTKLLDDDDGRVADACLVSLARLGDASVKNKFLSALESTVPQVRAKAAETLGDIGDATCFIPLRKRLKDWSRDVKAAATVALGKLRDKESIPVIREMLWDKDEIIRENAAKALGLIKDPETLDQLRKLLEDPNGTVRIAVADALYQMKDDSGKDFLVKSLTTDDLDARIKALEVFNKIAQPKDAPVLKGLLNDERKLVSMRAAEALIKITKNEGK
jgi:HEAT repeat protein